MIETTAGKAALKGYEVLLEILNDPDCLAPFRAEVAKSVIGFYLSDKDGLLWDLDGAGELAGGSAQSVPSRGRE